MCVCKYIHTCVCTYVHAAYYAHINVHIHTYVRNICTFIIAWRNFHRSLILVFFVFIHGRPCFAIAQYPNLTLCELSICTCVLSLHVCSVYMCAQYTCVLSLHVCSVYMCAQYTCVLSLHVCSICVYSEACYSGHLKIRTPVYLDIWLWSQILIHI